MLRTDLAAVIFDLDGCLVDSERMSIGAIMQEMHKLGVKNITFEEIRARFLGVSMSVICNHIASQTGKECGQDFIDRVEARMFEDYRDKPLLIEGVNDMLSVLGEAGVAIAVATGGSIRRMHKTLEFAGLTRCFEGVSFSADQVEHGKPAPDLFVLAARELGVLPGGCIVLEDSPHGVQGAKAAGMQAVGFVGGAHLIGIRDAHATLLRSKGAKTVVTDMTGAVQAFKASEVIKSAGNER